MALLLDLVAEYNNVFQVQLCLIVMSNILSWFQPYSQII